MDEVIIGAPYSVTKELLEKVYKIDVVAHGSTHTELEIDGTDPYALPKKLGIYRHVETSRSALSTDEIVRRIIEQRTMYEERNRKKQQKEIALIKSMELESMGAK